MLIIQAKVLTYEVHAGRFLYEPVLHEGTLLFRFLGHHLSDNYTIFKCIFPPLIFILSLEFLSRSFSALLILGRSSLFIRAFSRKKKKLYFHFRYRALSIGIAPSTIFSLTRPRKPNPLTFLNAARNQSCPVTWNTDERVLFYREQHFSLFFSQFYNAPVTSSLTNVRRFHGGPCSTLFPFFFPVSFFMHVSTVHGVN